MKLLRIIMSRNLFSNSSGQFWSSRTLTHWLMVWEVSVIILCDRAELVDARAETDLVCQSKSAQGDYEELCLTPGCIHSASEVLNNMDSSVDPCGDFYRYACGGFINRTTVPENESSVNYQMILQTKMRNWLKGKLQAAIDFNEPRHFKLAKNLYNICMNESAIAVAGLEPLRRQLNKLGGWPVVVGGAWNESSFDWVGMTYKFRDAGYPHTDLIHVGLVPDPKNKTKRVINIDRGPLRYYHDYVLLGLGSSDRRHKYMVDMSVQLGADRANAEMEVKKLLDFENQLKEIMMSGEEPQEKIQGKSPMTLTALSETYPSIPWQEYLNRLLPSSITVNENEVIVVSTPTYFRRLEKLLAETPKRTLANYLLWRPITFSKRYLDARSTLSHPEPAARSDVCCEIVSEQLPLIFAAVFVARYVDEEAKEKASTIATAVRRQFNDILKNLDWIDDETRMKALDKAAAMVFSIGYPDELLDNHKLEKYYEKLELFADNYLDSILAIRKFNVDCSLRQLRSSVTETQWPHPERSIWLDPLFSPDENNFLIPAGILQSVFFDKDRPNYMNYAAIGSIAGSGLTHGFDTLVQQHGGCSNGTCSESPPTEQRYRQLLQCITDQYANYTVPEIGLNLDGVSTLYENTADNGGIKIAYSAYKSWVAINGAEKKLPGIDRTPEEMFWLSSANARCAKYTRDGLLSAVSGDMVMRSPEEFQVLGMFSNIQEFANDFKCPQGSRMNPKLKCSFW